MSNNTSPDGLKEAIQLLELERELKKQVLKQKVQSVYIRFIPTALLNTPLHTSPSSPSMLDHIIDSTVGVAAGYLIKKIVIGRSNNAFRLLLGSIAHFGVLNLVAQHHTSIKYAGNLLFQLALNKIKSNHRDPSGA